MKKITVMFQYEDLGQQIEQRFPGFLTSSNHAMFVERYSLMIVPVEPTNDPTVFLGGHTFELGNVDDSSRNVQTIESVVKKLNNMTAYEFVTEILMSCRHIRDFDGKIIPPQTESDFKQATRKSGVA